ncbi:MAG: hypothetical protein RL483_112 [Pseudomonadota bacterium]
MNDLPLWAQGLALLLMLLISAFFSMSETGLMAVNRYRMRSLAAQGRRGARQVLRLLGKTDQLLATILLGNNLVNAALTAMITAIAIRTFGNNDEVLAIATGVAASLLIVFAEILPKVIGANRPEMVAMTTSHGLVPLVALFRPLVAVINRLVSSLLSLFRLKSPSGNREAMTTDDLRVAVLESSSFIPSQHRSIMLNLFDLEDLTVDDVMVPRGNIEALDLDEDDAVLIEQITTSFHNRLIVYRGDLSQVEGLLNVRRALSMIGKSEFSKERLVELLVPAYFVPSGTKLFSQLKFFQEQKKHLALVVDEYGEIDGLVTLQDIVEELVGEFDGQSPKAVHRMRWQPDGRISVDGMVLVRELNRQLGLDLPVDGPKTLNGLILEALQDLPESHVSLKVAGVPMEILQVQDRRIRRVALQRPLPADDHASNARPSEPPRPSGP